MITRIIDVVYLQVQHTPESVKLLGDIFQFFNCYHLTFF
jgi:hypothetical protein